MLIWPMIFNFLVSRCTIVCHIMNHFMSILNSYCNLVVFAPRSLKKTNSGV